MRHRATRGRPGSTILWPRSRIPWWLRPGRNPLRRPVDRIERLVMVGLLAVFAAGGTTAAIGAGRWAEHGAMHAARVQAAQWHRVPAHLLRSAAPPVGPADPSFYVSYALAWWVAPDGARRAGRIIVAAGARAGATVPLWTDASGRPTASPLARGQVAYLGLLAGTLVVIALAAFLAAAGAVARRVLDARRLAGWEAAWTVTGPQWTGHR